jgi:hypothetical protein
MKCSNVLSALADAVDIHVDKCKGVDMFKRHKAVYPTFIAHGSTCHYWLNPVPHDALV